MISVVKFIIERITDQFSDANHRRYDKIKTFSEEYEMITVKELAKLCDCSVATVNRALNDRPDINNKTKERIKQVAKDHGYRPHFIARSLATGNTNIIGLIVLDIKNPFFEHIIDYLNQRLLERGYSLHLGIMDGSPESEYRVFEQLAYMKVDGIIHVPLNVGDAYKTYLKKLHIPLVHLCNWYDDEFPFVGVEEAQIITEAVEHIQQAGYTELIYVSPPLRYKGSRNLYTLEERLKGVQSSIGDMKLHVLDTKDYLQKSIELVSQSHERSCFLCSSDIFALDIMTQMRSLDMTPPKDYGIIGFDNITFLKHISPRLTTIAYPVEELIDHALEELLLMIQGKQCISKHILKAHVIPGETI
jgi:LacI family transcriptional regulator